MAQNSQFDRHLSTSSASGRFSFARALSRRDAGSDSSHEAKGSFGLNTLFEPSGSAVANLIFVHGLGGGSRSTWTKSGDPSLYWPKEWLPQDTAFRDVCIHSFGYNSNWDKESTLNIHDFSKSLLGSLQDCPAVRKDHNVSILVLMHILKRSE